MREGIPLIKFFEGFRANAYLCPAGIPTIGYGETHNVKMGMTITEPEALEMLNRRYDEFEAEVISLLKVKYNANQLGALTSFAYNLGVGNLKKSSLLRDFNAGNTVAASNGFEKWAYARDPKTRELVILPGLEKRRLAEKNLFIKEVA
jgi:lysozyme